MAQVSVLDNYRDRGPPRQSDQQHPPVIAEFAVRVRSPQPARALDELTAREREVVGLVAAGLSNDDIAPRVYVSQSTVKTHVTRAMTKLAARDRAQLVVAAYESGLARPGWAGAP